MTTSLCLKCGILKGGALNECPSCEHAPLDWQAATAFTDHYLTESELGQLGRAIQILSKVDVDDETRYQAFVYFVARKWPKILEYGIEEVDSELATILDSIYRTHLVSLPSQQSLQLRSPEWEDESWLHAGTSEFQIEEDAWKEGISNIVQYGLNTAHAVVTLKIEIGEGAVLQKLAWRTRNAINHTDFSAAAQRIDPLIADSAEYKRLVKRYQAPVVNGWSGQSKKRSAYLGGTYVRLEEMAKLCGRLIRHKAGIESLIPLEVERVKQELKFSYATYISLVELVLCPEKITCSTTEGD